MFVHMRWRRVGESPNRRVGCEHRGPGRRAMRPYLVRNIRRWETNGVDKEYVVPLTAHWQRTCCLEEDYRRRCWVWWEAEGVLGGLHDRALKGELSHTSMADFDTLVYQASMRKLARYVPYPEAWQWTAFRRSPGWLGD